MNKPDAVAHYTVTPLQIVFNDFQTSSKHLILFNVSCFKIIEDVSEEIVGKIFSETSDDREEIKQIGANRCVVKGITHLTKLNNVLKLDLLMDEFVTLNGFLMSEIGYIPLEGEQLTIFYNHLIFDIISVEKNRIEKVIITIGDK